jgi:hypothetical protein
LYVQNYSSNLLSIRKIINELNYEIIFTLEVVVFQEWITKKIGEGIFENGLYFLNEKDTLSIQKRRSRHSLAQKIGHPSDKILKSLFDFKNLDCSSSEVYKLGKHNNLLLVYQIIKAKNLLS